jgi:hypothetical protein
MQRKKDHAMRKKDMRLTIELDADVRINCGYHTRSAEADYETFMQAIRQRQLSPFRPLLLNVQNVCLVQRLDGTHLLYRAEIPKYQMRGGLALPDWRFCYKCGDLLHTAMLPREVDGHMVTFRLYCCNCLKECGISSEDLGEEREH